MRDKEKIIEEILRVNHAGEFGATRIYKGQLSLLKNTSSSETVEHMLEQEEHHKQIFDELVVKNKARPTALSPLWQGLGYALGYGSALLGKRAAMACTVAVEEVIDEHYQSQLEEMENTGLNKGDTQEIYTAIEKCRAEEIEHRDIAIEHEAKKMVGYKPFTVFVKAASKLAIALSKRI